MTTFVLDSSAVLALFWQEPGGERVTEILEGGDHLISAVNLVEIVTKFVDAGMPRDEITHLVGALRLNVQPLDARSAMEAGALRAAARSLGLSSGLSLGDRACLALAKSTGAVAVTADRPWTRIAPDLGIVVECIRGDLP